MAASFFVLRKLTGSELGWFAGPRRLGKAKGRQRGINFNASVMKRIFPPEVLRRREIRIVSRRISDGQRQARPLRRQEKNWRLVGDMVSGPGLEDLQEGDFFVGEVKSHGSEPFEIVWDVVLRAHDADLHERLAQEFSVFLKGGMASWDESDPVGQFLATKAGLRTAKAEDGAQKVPPEKKAQIPAGGNDYQLPPKLPSKPIPPAPKTPQKRKRIGDRLRRPNILTEIVKSGLALSAKAQADFIDVLDTLSSELRALLSEAKRLHKVEINHKRVWSEVKGLRIGFVDGGMANVASVGSAPLALRVGSYVVMPGEPGPDREQFDFEIILVDDLYESSPTRPGVYEDMFEDLAKLRDAARIAAEAGGLLSLSLRRPRPPTILFLHGPLVNPVSPYALGVPGQKDAFPNYTRDTLKKLLPGDDTARTGRDTNFVAVYLEQLNRLKRGANTVCGVVERPSSAAPGPLIRAILHELHDEGRIDGATLDTFLTRMEGYHITDSLIFECVLDEGEYVAPVELDKQGPQHKIPVAWAPEIGAYPKPLTTYVKTNSETMPIRVESFKAGPLTHEQLMRLVVHMSRLLPHYAFPVGLDIVDKHAKVPEWMSKQMSAMLSAQLMRKAMESGNPATIRWVRRVLSANVRDWLFRPDFRGG